MADVRKLELIFLCNCCCCSLTQVASSQKLSFPLSCHQPPPVLVSLVMYTATALLIIFLLTYCTSFQTTLFQQFKSAFIPSSHTFQKMISMHCPWPPMTTSDIRCFRDYTKHEYVYVHTWLPGSEVRHNGHNHRDQCRIHAFLPTISCAFSRLSPIWKGLRSSTVMSHFRNFRYGCCSH
jgi:hypothetical protein